MTEPVQTGDPVPRNPPSDLFLDVIQNTGGIRRECEFCGRVFFEDDEGAGDWESGELEELRRRAKEEPDKVFGCDSVHSGTIDGKDYVLGCPCNAVRRHEDFIWGHRRLIMDFISRKVKDMVERALEDEGLSDAAMADLEVADKAENTVRCPKCLKFVKEVAMAEGGICVKCWDLVQKEAEADRIRAEEEQARHEEEVRAAFDSDDNLPF